jgi:tRNA dimethylallyltransferase
MGSPVLFVVGPTASGKTEASLAIAGALGSVQVVNADSRQVYLGMTIGTAKPSARQLAEVAHHLIDVAEPWDGYGLARFLRHARGAIDGVLAGGGRPVVVGGTGQYVWGLAEGWQVPEVPPQPEIRRELEAEAVEHGAEALHARLARVDPEAAAAIDARNVRRVVRALEVWRVTGRRFSGLRRRSEKPFTPHVVGMQVERAELHRRIAARVEAMLAAGWLAEVKRLLEAGCGPELPAFSSVGYREMVAHLRGELSLEEAVGRTIAATHRLVRRQGAWFKAGDERIAWVGSAEEAVAWAGGVLGE